MVKSTYFESFLYHANFRAFCKVYLFFAIAFYSQNLFAQAETNFAQGGAVVVGDSTSACPGAPSIEGAIRYDADGADTLDYCTGSGWVTMLTSSIGDAIVNNGNSFAAPMVIGTNDSQSLSFETNNTVAMTIDTSGNVGIGTSSPGAALDIPVPMDL